VGDQSDATSVSPHVSAVLHQRLSAAPQRPIRGGRGTSPQAHTRAAYNTSHPSLGHIIACSFALAPVLAVFAPVSLWPGRSPSCGWWQRLFASPIREVLRHVRLILDA
jgi:hypothetical protein